MRKIFIAALFVSGCAIGEMADEIEEKLNKVDTTLDDLHTSECILACNDDGQVCLEEANGACVDSCEADKDACDSFERDCFEVKFANCSQFQDEAYFQCVYAAEFNCDQGCDDNENDCNQGCGEVAQDCLTVNADCVAMCVGELEDSLQDLNLNE